MPNLGTISFTTPVTNALSTPVTGLGKINALSLVANFDCTGGGTTAKAYAQTSLDGGSTWYDIAAFAFTTSSAVNGSNIDGRAQIAAAALTTGTLTDNTDQHGILGDQLRFAITTTGTYAAGTSLKIDYSPR